MRRASLLLLGLFLLSNLLFVQPCFWRRRRCRPRPNQLPRFNFKCYEDVYASADSGKTGTYVFWPNDKWTATDPDSHHRPQVSLVTSKKSGSYFDGRFAFGSTVMYKALDSRNGVAYCTFRVHVSVKYCFAVPSLQHGRCECSGSISNVYGSTCTSTCDLGYELDGVEKVACGSNQLWNHSFPTCQPISCGYPGTVTDGQVQCPIGTAYSSYCFVQCNTGFQYDNYSHLIKCRDNGTWEDLHSCRDVQAPTFPSGCPSDQTLHSNVAVTWLDPQTSDNSQETVTLTSDPARGTILEIGMHVVTITATDSSGNSRNCTFLVEVIPRTCPTLQIDQGSVSCSSHYLVGSQCTVTCNQGYTLQGNANMTCTSTEQGETWSPPGTSCEVVECPPPYLNHGRYECPNGWSHTKWCLPECDSGFKHDGPHFIRCSANGSWAYLGRCQDVAPPEFRYGCPDNINAYAASLGEATLIEWNDPEVTDNSGSANYSSDHRPGSEFPVGVTTVTYNATDPSGNTRRCSFTVEVKTVVCPTPDLEVGKTRKLMAYSCPDGFVFGAACTLNCTYGYPLVGSATITCARDDRTYPPTSFWEWDGPSSVPPKCAESSCPDLEPPENGAFTCVLGNFGWDCLMNCQEPYDVPAVLTNGGHFYCTNSRGTWEPSTVPDCTVFVRPGGARVHSDLFYYSNSCNVSNEELRQNFITRMSSSNVLRDACVGVPTCVVENVEVYCGALRRKRDEDGNRKRRDLEEQHQIFRRQAETSSHYVLISYDVAMNLSANASSTSQEIFQTGEEVKQKLYDAMVEAVQNGTFDEEGLYLDSQAVGSPQLIMDCPEGTLPRQHHDRVSCVGCSKGYSLSDQKSCEECPVGTYSDTDNATECIPCPQGTSTRTPAATTISQCIKQCPEGHMSPDGFVPCQPCPAGQYHAGVEAKNCDPCPLNTWTPNAGATNFNSCVEADLELSNSSFSSTILGNWSSVTVSLRVAFPESNSSITISIRSSVTGSVLTSLVLSGMDMVDEVRESTKRLFHHVMFVVTTPVGGQLPENLTVLTVSEDLPSSTVLTVYSQHRQVWVSSLAVFGGVPAATNISSLTQSCTVDVADNLLTWPPDHGVVMAPSVCDAVDDCSSEPCGDHGVCVNLLGGYECRCQDEWSGAHCQDSPNPCVNHQCQNDATCVAETDSYVCTCTDQYSGDLCHLKKVDGGWTEWQPWTPCGCRAQHQRQRFCTNPTPQNGGHDCIGNDTEVGDCFNEVCTPDEGVWDNWTMWSNCSASCGGGQTTRNRTCQSVSGSGQGLCEGNAYDVQACNTQPCPIAGGWSSWSLWSLCSASCGGGNQSRVRSCDSPVPANGGDWCSGSQTDSQSCATHDCPECPVLKRPAGGTWSCTGSQSPYFQTCTLKCLPFYVEVNPSSPIYCGHNTSYAWSHQHQGQNSLSSSPECSRSRPFNRNTATFTASAVVNTGCDPTTAEDYSKGVADNIANVSCVAQSACQVSTSTTCVTSPSRKRSTPSLQIALEGTLDLNITDSDLENNDTAWESYLDIMNVVNQSLPDDDSLESLLTVTLPGGQTVTPDMTSAVTDLNLTCAPGMIIREYTCVECPAGSMEENGQCVQCPLGFYQDQPAATSCLPCPPGLTWDLIGATSLLQCVFPVEESTTIPMPSSTTAVPEQGEEPVDWAVVIGVPCGALVAMFAIALIIKYTCKNHSRTQRSARRGSRLSLHKLFPAPFHADASYPRPFQEVRAPPSYQEAIDAGVAPVRHTMTTTFVEERPTKAWDQAEEDTIAELPDVNEY